MFTHCLSNETLVLRWSAQNGAKEPKGGCTYFWSGLSLKPSSPRIIVCFDFLAFKEHHKVHQHVGGRVEHKHTHVQGQPLQRWWTCVCRWKSLALNFAGAADLRKVKFRRLEPLMGWHFKPLSLGTCAEEPPVYHSTCLPPQTKRREITNQNVGLQ